jgi:hypothetical protein
VKTRSESRVFPALAVVALVALIALLPAYYRVMPEWFLFAAGAAFVAPMLLGGFASTNPLWAAVERNAVVIVAVAVTVIEVIVVARLVSDIVGGHQEISPIALLSTAVAIWATNVIVFALIYWQLDRGGPRGRSTGWSGRADLTFSHGEPSDGMPADWQPLFADYLFLAFTTSTAFSPTDTLPLTRRAKMLMMAQSAISLVTIVIVAARAINVLGT